MSLRYFINLRGTAVGTVERARALEAAGWDGLTFGDHRTNPRDLWATLGAVAAATSRVTLLSAFANNLFRHPVDFARGAVTVQAIAAGRFEAGLGAGWLADDHVAIGEVLPSPGERVDRLREAVEIVAELFRQRSCHHRGVHYRVDVDEFASEGEPPPLVVALGGPRSCRLIAPLVDRVEVMFGAAVAGGSLDFAAFARLTESELRDRVEIVREAAPHVPVGLGLFVAAGSGPQLDQLRTVAGNELQGELVGEPRAVADAIRALADMEVDRITLVPMTPDTSEQLAPLLLDG